MAGHTREEWQDNLLRVDMSAFDTVFGVKAKRAFKTVSAPTRKSVNVDYESHDYANPAATWIKGPYYIGVAANLSITHSRQGYLNYLFQEAYWNELQRELRYLLANKVTHNYGQVVWLTHVVWLVHNMLLATNVYPMFWSEAVLIAAVSGFVLPEVGWDARFDWVSKTKPSVFAGQDVPLDTWPGGRYPFAARFFQPMWGNWGMGTTPSKMSKDDALTWWSGSFRWPYNKTTYTPQGLAVNQMPWAGLTSKPLSGYTNQKTFEARLVRRETSDSGLRVLIERARMFGGIDDVFWFFGGLPPDIQKSFVTYWTKIAHQLAASPFWSVVRGGVSAWRWHCMLNLYTCSQPACASDVLLPTARRDMKDMLTQYLDSKKTARRMIFTQLAIKTAKVMAKAIQGDLIGTAKEYIDLRKWDRQQERAGDPSVPPEKYAFLMPPPFIRNVGKLFDVYGDPAPILIDGLEDAGTGAVTAHVERAIRGVEKVIGTWLWEPPPPAAAQEIETPQVKKPVVVYVPPTPEGIRKTPGATRGWLALASAVAAAGGYFWWKRGRR